MKTTIAVVKATIAVMIGAGLLVLCACAKQGHATTTPTDAPPSTRTAVLTQTAPLTTTLSSSPSPAPTIVPPDQELDRQIEPVGSAIAGVPLTYTLTITNYGPSDATGVIVTDTLPAGAGFVSATSSQGNGCRAIRPGLITCEMGDLRIGKAAKIVVVVIPVATARLIHHTAVVAANEIDVDLSDNTLYRETSVESVIDLAIQAQASHQAIPGGQISYTLTVHNHGPAPATGIVLTDVLPTGVIPLWTQTAHPLCGRLGSTVGCDLGDLRGSDAATITLDLSVSGTETLVTGTQLAGVTLDLSAPTCMIGLDPAQPYIMCHVANLESGAGVDLHIGVNIDTQITGALVHTTTVRAHETDADWSNNHIVSTMTVGAATPLAVNTISGTTDLILQADAPQTIIAGQPMTYTFTITNRGDLDATGVIFQNALPPGTTLSRYRPNLPFCKQQSDTFTCHLRNPNSNETVTFTLVITGSAEMPMSVELDPLLPGWPLCTVAKERSYLHIVECNLGVLKRGAATKVQLVLIPEGVLERTVINMASVNANEDERNDLDNTVTTTTTVQVEADLVVRSLISDPAIAGKTLSYTWTIINNGPSDTTDVVVAATLPASTTLVSAIPSQGEECQAGRGDGSTNILMCDLDRLNSGEMATITITVTVDQSLTPRSAKVLTHSADVTSKQADPNLSNNEVTESIPVSAEIDLSITDD